MLKVGQTAIDFPVAGRTLFALLDEGKAVVFFFPAAFTPG